MTRSKGSAQYLKWSALVAIVFLAAVFAGDLRGG